MIVHAYDLFHINVGALGIKRLNNDHLKIERPSAGNQGNGPGISPESLIQLWKKFGAQIF